MSLEDDHPSLDGSRPKKELTSEDGAETVSKEVDGLNARFSSAAEGLAEMLRQIGQTVQEEEEEDEEDRDGGVSRGETDGSGSRRQTSTQPDVKVSAVWLRGASVIRAWYVRTAFVHKKVGF